MRRIATMFLVLVCAVFAMADTLESSVSQLGSAVAARIAALEANPARTKLEKNELKKLQLAANKLLLVPGNGQLRDLLALAPVGSPLLGSRTKDQAIQDAVVRVANCILVFVQDEVQEANAARHLIENPEDQAKIDKALTKANKAFNAAQNLFQQNPGPAIGALVEAAVAYRKIRNKAFDIINGT